MEISEYSFNTKKLIQLRGDEQKTVIARKLGLSRQLWDYYEKGGSCPSVFVLAKILNYFRKTADPSLKFEDFLVPAKKRSRTTAKV